MKWRGRKLEPSIWLTAIVAIVFLAAAPFATAWLKEPIAARAAPLPLSFPHSKHVGTYGCATCHHNFTDKIGGGLPCIHCHKSDRPDLKRGIEAEFHDLCKGCHADEARKLAKHGPIRECKGCHVATADGFLP
jgi:predicted CXXCH cytochrome family protein